MRYLLPLIVLLAAGCTRYSDGSWRWHTLGGPPGARSEKAVQVLDELDGTAEAERRSGTTR